MTPTYAKLHDLAQVDLYWLPLGAGAATAVRWSGRVYEAITAQLDHRQRRDLYHSALQVHVGDDHFVIEMAPAWSIKQPDRGVVGEGAVALKWLGHSRFSAMRFADGGAAPSRT